MTFASLFSGIGGWDCGMEQAGFQSLWFCELDKACQSVLRRHWKTQPIFGDINSVDFNQVEKPDILCISAPCQAFSVAGLRGSLADDRGNLTLKSVEVANVLSPKIIVYENVPGILNTRDNAFGCFLAALVGADAPLVPPAECGWTDAGLVVGPKRTAAYRVLDSQYFGLAQRRRRVFVVADTLGGCSGQILFECQSSRRNPPARGKAGQGITRDVAPSLAASGRGTERCGESRGQDCVIPEVTGTIGARTTAAGGFGSDFECVGGVTPTLGTRGTPSMGTGMGQDFCIPDITHTLKGEGFDGSEDGTGRGTPLAVETMATLDTHEGDKWGCDQWVKSGKPIVESERITALSHVTRNRVSYMAKGGDPTTDNYVVSHTLRSGGDGEASHRKPSGLDETLTPVAYRTSGNCGPFEQGDKTGALNTATDPNQNIIAFTQNQSVDVLTGDVMASIGTNQNATGRNTPKVMQGTMRVRRLTPVECARLQGFPDGWNNFLSDSAAYKQYGNAVSVPVIRWIAHRIKHFLA